MQDGLEDFVTAFEDDFQQLLREFVFVATGESTGVVVDWRARVIDQENTLLRFGNLHEYVLGMVFDDGLRQCFVRLVQF